MYYTRALAVMRALIGGLGDVVRAPAIVIASIVAMLLIALPFAVALGARLEPSLSHQQPVAEGSADIDADWWREYVEQSEGLSATFTPMVLGLAAPLDNISSLLEGTRRPVILFVPIGIALVVWALIWGAALDRFAHGRNSAGLWRAAMRTMVPFTAISGTIAAVMLTVSYTLDPPAILFGVVLVAVSVIADYARVHLVLGPSLSLPQSLRGSWQFVREHPVAVVMLYGASASLFVVLLAGYGAIETAAGIGTGGWRSIAIAQAYIIGRVVVRLTFGAAAVRLYRALAPHGAS